MKVDSPRIVVIDQLPSEHVERRRSAREDFLKAERVYALVIRSLDEVPAIVKLVFEAALSEQLEAAARKYPAKKRRRELIVRAGGVTGSKFSVENEVLGWLLAEFGSRTARAVGHVNEAREA